MKTSFWRRWCNSLFRARVTGPISRGRSRRQRLCLEGLEDRVTPSLTPQMVLDINPGGASSNWRSLVAIGSTTYFAADDGVHGVELWKSDGTVAGTTLVKDFSPGGHTGYYGGYYPYSSYPGGLTNVNGTLFFWVHGTGIGPRLWKSDGTEAGTVMVASVNSAVGLPEARGNPTNVNGTLFFTSGDSRWGFDGVELWNSDGTTVGTVLVKDIFPGRYRGAYVYYPNSSFPSNLTNVNGTLFFTADGSNGRELWKSAGTAAGTVLVKDIIPGSAGSGPGYLTNVNGTLFFTASAGNGRELWKSDGTEAGTVQVKDIFPGSTGSYPHSLMNMNGTLFFTASDGTNGWELWRSDGTAAGTVLVKDIRPGSSNAYPNGLTNVSGTLFFVADNATTGRELWKSDGTAAGTVLVQDINPGSTGSNPGYLTNVNGTLFFSADDGTRGLWQSDGTEAGTVPVSSSVQLLRNLTDVNGTLFFSADDGVHGWELWKLVDDGLPSLAIGNTTVTEGHVGTQSATFTVTLSAASTLPVTVSYATSDGTATAPSDYAAASGTLTFAPGETSKTVTVQANGDRLVESNETFFVSLSSPTNVTIGDGVGQGTILDDEPRISISDVTVTEGNTGTVNAAFAVTLSVPYDLAVTVSYATANGTATGGSDYQAAFGTRTIPAGQTSGTVTVLVNGDRLGEPNETFFVDLSNPTYGAIADGQSAATIIDDEPRVSISDVSKKEGKRGQTTQFTFTVSLSAASDQAVTMSFHTLNGTAKTSDDDCIAKTGTLTFNPGETTKTITIEVRGDSKKEANETFYLDLFGLSGNSLFTKNRGIGTILNDD
jgi:ELWxxDGT repeat protein